MATNLDLDPALVERALALSGANTKKAAVTRALEEFVASREQARVQDLFEQLDSTGGQSREQHVGSPRLERGFD